MSEIMGKKLIDKVANTTLIELCKLRVRSSEGELDFIEDRNLFYSFTTNTENKCPFNIVTLFADENESEYDMESIYKKLPPSPVQLMQNINVKTNFLPSKNGFHSLPKTMVAGRLAVPIAKNSEINLESYELFKKENLGTLGEDYKLHLNVEDHSSDFYQKFLEAFFKNNFGAFKFMFNEGSLKSFYKMHKFPYLTPENIRTLVITHKNQIVSYLQIFLHKTPKYTVVGMENVGTLKKHRRKKLSTRLCIEALRIAKMEWNADYMGGFASAAGLKLYSHVPNLQLGNNIDAFVSFKRGNFGCKILHLIFGVMKHFM